MSVITRCRWFLEKLALCGKIARCVCAPPLAHIKDASDAKHYYNTLVRSPPDRRFQHVTTTPELGHVFTMARKR